MKRLLLCLFAILAIFLSPNLTFASNSTTFQIGASQELVDVTKLYVEEGEGKYAGYKALKGYPGEERFQVYFQDGHITYEDLRGIDPNEIIEWEMDGKTMRHYRKDIYRMFSDTSKLYSRRPEYTGQFSQEWNSKTFGKVYDEWFDGMIFLQDAETLLKRYFEYKNPPAANSRYDLSNIKIENK